MTDLNQSWLHYVLIQCRLINGRRDLSRPARKQEEEYVQLSGSFTWLVRASYQPPLQRSYWSGFTVLHYHVRTALPKAITVKTNKEKNYRHGLPTYTTNKKRRAQREVGGQSEMDFGIVGRG